MEMTEPLETPGSVIRRFLSSERPYPADVKHAEDESTALKHLWQSGQGFAKIGAGACGEVYQQSGANYADIAKRAKTEHWHLRVQDAVSLRRVELDLEVRVPRAKGFVTREVDEHAWWAENPDKFPGRVEALPKVVLLAERILPVPTEIRHSLIELYCEERIQQAARNDPGNLDCLVRLYLGKPRPERRTTSMLTMFDLRNFQLYLSDMEILGLDTKLYAISMAKALALMHWEVKCDANDVEFVLGSARSPDTGGNERAVDLWLLDFNRVRPMTTDADGIKLATDAFMVNDRYYPRPLGESTNQQKLWSTFASAYLDASKRLHQLQEAEGKMVDWQGLPETFLAAVVEAQEQLLLEKVHAEKRVL